MVDPVTDTIVIKGTEGAVSVATEAAKSAVESAQASAIKGIGEGIGSGGSGYGPPVGGTMEGVGGGYPNLTGGPMPEGFVPDPVGGTQRGVGGQSMPGKEGGPQQPQEKSFMSKLRDFMKEHDVMNKVRFVEMSYHGTSQAGKDLMGQDAHKYDPVSKVRPMESQAARWDKWH
jgi:hypothetical protein